MKINIGGRTLEAWLDFMPKDTRWFNRESVSVHVEMPFDEAKDIFVDDVQWSMSAEGVDLEGNRYTNECDMSTYAMAGPITDNRDGTVTVKMGRYLPDELLATTLHCVPESHKAATALRGIIETAVQSIEDDAVALIATALYPVWDALTGTELAAGMRIQHEGKLYRVITPHTVQPEHAPGAGTESLYTRIDESHSGTVDDPIPYEGNMALSAGLHYTQGGVTYLCSRDTVNPVYSALADLVGLYVEVVA